VTDLPGPPHDPRRRPPPPLDELIDAQDLAPEAVEELRATDALLRSVSGPPPQVPASLGSAVTALARRSSSSWTRRRTLAAVALAAALAALSFGLGTRVGGADAFEERAAFAMEPTAEARAASAVIRLGERDDNGNWPLRLEVEGLPRLPPGGYYALWLARDGEYEATCGSFSVGEGTTEAEWTVSYRFGDFDTWVVTARVPGRDAAEAPWLLRADVDL
jgi:hypothetical protein